MYPEYKNEKEISVFVILDECVFFVVVVVWAFFVVCLFVFSFFLLLFDILSIFPNEYPYHTRVYRANISFRFRINNFMAHLVSRRYKIKDL